jgi:hypothetical protein
MFPVHRSGWGFIVAGLAMAEASLSMASQRHAYPSYTAIARKLQLYHTRHRMPIRSKATKPQNPPVVHLVSSRRPPVVPYEGPSKDAKKEGHSDCHPPRQILYYANTYCCRPSRYNSNTPINQPNLPVVIKRGHQSVLPFLSFRIAIPGVQGARQYCCTRGFACPHYVLGCYMSPLSFHHTV